MNARSTRGLAFGLTVALFLFSMGSAIAGAQKAKVNINTASVSELEALPRIGPKVAQRIVDFRTKQGDFKKIEEIMKVQGIGEKIFDQIKDLITVGPMNQGK